MQIGVNTAKDLNTITERFKTKRILGSHTNHRSPYANVEMRSLIDGSAQLHGENVRHAFRVDERVENGRNGIVRLRVHIQKPKGHRIPLSLSLPLSIIP